MPTVAWFALTFFLVIGLSTITWASVGVGRLSARQFRRVWPAEWDGNRWEESDVAIVIAARNEELVLPSTLRAARQIVPARQIFVISDASTDATASIARAEGARVMELVHNRGKAGAIVAGLRHFGLVKRFAIVMLLDADTRPSPDYLVSGLRLFEHKGVVAVAGRAATLIDGRSSGLFGTLLLAYRERTYVAMQTLFKFGQAARQANAVTIVPGFASMYRTNILDKVDIAAPGLAIEDYNMTFEIHSKRLGRVAFDPSAAVAYTQDPDTLGEYVRQMSRWSLGFWQTVRRHRMQFGVFWVGLAFFAFEVFVSSILMVLVPLAALVLLVSTGFSDLGMNIGGPLGEVGDALPVLAILLGVLVPDALLSLYVAVVTRDVRYLLLGVAFPLLRMLDAAVCLRALKRAVIDKSSGVWASPVRR